MHDFNQTYVNYGRMVAGIARHRSRDGTIDREELLQEIWLSVWRQWGELRDLPHRLGGILKRIANQTATMMWKHNTATKRHAATVDLDHIVISQPATQEHRVMVQELAASVARLPATQQAALAIIATGEGLLTVAAADGVSKQAIQHRQTAARKQLRKMGH